MDTKLGGCVCGTRRIECVGLDKKKCRSAVDGFFFFGQRIVGKSFLDEFGWVVGRFGKFVRWLETSIDGLDGFFS